MSFILDALKKSDNKRPQTSPPRLDTDHGQAAQSRRRPLRGYLLGLVLLLNVGLLLWFFVPWRPAPLADSKPAVAIQRPEVNLPPLAAIEIPRPQADPAAPLAAIKPPAQAPAQASVQLAPVPLDENRIYLLSELPTAVRRRIPPLHMSLHAFSKAGGSAGLVRINDQMLREGARLDGRFLLDRISPDGAVFRFEGYRFLLPRRGQSDNR